MSPAASVLPAVWAPSACYEMLDKITKGQGTHGRSGQDGRAVLLHQGKFALCGLGQTAPNPVLSHPPVLPRRVCGPYRRTRDVRPVSARHCCSYADRPDKCKGCTLCARVCPAGAITGTVKEPHVIDPDKCLKCGACMEKCHFGAIVQKSKECVKAMEIGKY